MIKKMEMQTQKKIVLATAITTILSATAAVVIKVLPRSRSIKVDLKQEDNEGFNAVLEGLVKANTVTKAQVVAIKDGVNTTLEGLVKDGTITQAEVVAIQGGFKTVTPETDHITTMNGYNTNHSENSSSNMGGNHMSGNLAGQEG